MFEEVKVASVLQKFFWNNPTLLPADEALAIATLHGAQALGLETGRLVVGTPADIVLVSVDIACNTPLHNATSNLVYACSGSAVETTICNGRVLMLDRNVPGEEQVLEGAAKAAQELVKRAQAS
jgi:5-methylthioadenosine/S-adenosylhomocysteine deaminase